jgi:dsDNA-binding SOS-regulon protein
MSLGAVMVHIIKSRKIILMAVLLSLLYQPVAFGSLMSSLQFQFSTLFNLFNSPFFNNSSLRHIKPYAVPTLKGGAITGLLMLAKLLTPYPYFAVSLAIGGLYASDTFERFADRMLQRQEDLSKQQLVTDQRVAEVQGTIDVNERQRQYDHQALLEKQQSLMGEHAKTQELINKAKKEQDAHNKASKEDAEKHFNFLNRQASDLLDQQKALELLLVKNKEDLENTFKVGIDEVREDMRETIGKVGDDIANKVVAQLKNNNVSNNRTFRTPAIAQFYQ